MINKGTVAIAHRNDKEVVMPPEYISAHTEHKAQLKRDRALARTQHTSLASERALKGELDCRPGEIEEITSSMN